MENRGQGRMGQRKRKALKSACEYCEGSMGKGARTGSGPCQRVRKGKGDAQGCLTGSDGSSRGKKGRKWWEWLYCSVGKGLIKREKRKEGEAGQG